MFDRVIPNLCDHKLGLGTFSQKHLNQAHVKLEVPKIEV